MSDTTTRGIRIQVKTRYLPERSSPENHHYYFTYRVRVSNTGRETTQLMSRKWIITDADGSVQEVQGPGVVGQQPVLEPGSSFEYSSFCPLRTPVGSMYGSYRMLEAGGDEFEAEIRPFTLAVPSAVN
jgi:ApaG protein